MTTATVHFSDTRDAIQLNLPDLDAHGINAPPVQDAIARYNVLAAGLGKAREEHHRLVEGRPAAVQADRAAYGAAWPRDPGSKALEAHEKAVAAAARQVDALQIAVGTAADNVVAALDDHRDVILGDVEARLAEAAASQAAAVEAWAEARAHRARLYALRSWASEFPDRLRYPSGNPGRIVGLPGLNNDDYLGDAVLDALRRDANG
jgi:hypothetical protein